MTTKFLHISDTHLGAANYGLQERAMDLARSLKEAITHSIQEGVNFILIAGDFFDKKDTKPEFYRQAVKALKPARDAGIPVLAICGNHDKGYYVQRGSWLDALNDDGHFQLLAHTVHEDGSITYDEYDETTRKGGMVTFPELGVRILGSPDMGNNTVQMLPLLADAIPRDDLFNIQMLHLGLTGQMPDDNHALNPEELNCLKSKVDYVALGHYHKRYSHEDWIHNPGGTENRSRTELKFDHGYHIVTVTNDKQVNIEFYEGWRRPFYRDFVEIDADTTPEQLDITITQLVNKAVQVNDMPPIIDLTVKGAVMKQYAHLNLNAIAKRLSAESGALVVRIDADLTDMEGHIQLGSKGTINRGEIEDKILTKRVPQVFGDLDEKPLKDVVVRVVSLKKSALDNDDPQEVVKNLHAWRKQALPLEVTV